MIVNILSPDFRKDPYPTFKILRSEAPVCQTEPYGHWLVSRYSDVMMILKNPEIFKSSEKSLEPNTEPLTLGPEFLLNSRGLVGTDRPEHTRIRSLISRAFTPQTVRSLEASIRSLVKDLIHDILAGNHSDDGFDLVKDFAVPLPITVVSKMMGIDSKKAEDFKRWADTLITWKNTQYIQDTVERQTREQQISNDMNHMFDYFTQMIADRSRQPKADLISAMVVASEGKPMLTPEEVLGFIRLLLVAGTETVTHLIGNTVLALLSHPDQWKLARQESSRIPNLIEEALRYDSPAKSLSRRVDSDTEIAGIKLKKNELVLPLLGSANHDESVFPHSERFDIMRDTQKHLAFGAGIHFCMGSSLARVQARIAFEEFIAVFKSFERTKDAPLDYVDSFFFRGVRSLKLVGTLH